MAEQYKAKEGTKGLAVVVVEDNYEDLGNLLYNFCLFFRIALSSSSFEGGWLWCTSSRTKEGTESHF